MIQYFSVNTVSALQHVHHKAGVQFIACRVTLPRPAQYVSKRQNTHVKRNIYIREHADFKSLPA